MSRFQLLASCVIITFLGCVEEVKNPEETFTKSYGDELQSIGIGVKEIDNRYFILGLKESAVVNEKLGNETTEISTSINTAPYLAIADPFGELIFERVFPIDSLGVFHGGIKALSPPYFRDIHPLDNGYIITGIIPNADITIPVFGLTIERDLIPFFVILDENFNVKDIMSPNGQQGWLDQQPIGRTDANMYENSSGQKYILYSGAGSAIGDMGSPVWFSIQLVDEFGNFDAPKDFEDPALHRAPAFGMVFDEDQNPVVLAFRSTTNSLNGLDIVQIDLESNQVTRQTIRADSQEETIQSINGTLILKFDQGYATFCNCWRQDDFMLKFNNDFVRTDSVAIPALADIRNLYGLTASDGNFILVTDKEDNGSLMKITPAGELLWEQQFDGFPRSVIETTDGSILVLTNQYFFGQNRRATLLKYRQDGTM